jgi:hypothetical protein
MKEHIGNDILSFKSECVYCCLWFNRFHKKRLAISDKMKIKFNYENAWNFQINS